MKQTLLLTFIGLIMFSCNTTDNEMNTEKQILFGEIHPDLVIHTEFETAILIKGDKQGTDTDYSYADSVEIDLNFDGINDIGLNYYQTFYQPDCNSVEIDGCMPFGSAFCKLEILTNVEIACTSYQNKYQPERFTYGDIISKELNWVKNGEEFTLSA